MIDLISLAYIIIYTDDFFVTLTSLNKIAELLAFFQVTKHGHGIGTHLLHHKLCLQVPRSQNSLRTQIVTDALQSCS